ncbi:hypothetical protein [Actinoplanes sp. NPDC049265]|uniref:hypothetical protein n=1 Tax=Actinoplanes sp. NPDC049265 TaxID=3363902 RepID=UPI00371F8DBE
MRTVEVLMGHMTLTADIFVDREIPVEVERDLVDALTAAGVYATAKVVPNRRGMSDVSWLILIAVPVQAFLNSLGEAAAADVWARVKAALRRMPRKSVAGRSRPVILQDPETGLSLVLPPDLSDEGYRQLGQLDLSAFVEGPIRYDTPSRRWVSDSDDSRKK